MAMMRVEDVQIFVYSGSSFKIDRVGWTKCVSMWHRHSRRTVGKSAMT